MPPPPPPPMFVVPPVSGTSGLLSDVIALMHNPLEDPAVIALILALALEDLVVGDASSYANSGRSWSMPGALCREHPAPQPKPQTKPNEKKTTREDRNPALKHRHRRQLADMVNTHSSEGLAFKVQGTQAGAASPRKTPLNHKRPRQKAVCSATSCGKHARKQALSGNQRTLKLT